MPENLIHNLPKDKLNWEYLSELKGELPTLSPNWIKSQEYDRARLLEDLIIQLTNYLTTQKL